MIWKNIKKIYKYSKGANKYLFAYMVCIPITCAISIIVPLFTSKQIIYVNNSVYNEFITAALIIFTFEVTRNVIRYISRNSINIYFRESLKSIQLKALKAVTHIQNKELDTIPSGVIIERVNSDCGRIADCIPTIIENLTDIISNFGVIITIFVLNKILFLYLVSCSALLFIIKNVRIRKWFVFDKKRRTANEKSTSFICEMIRGIRDIKVLNANLSFLNEAKNRIDEKNEISYKGQKVLFTYDFFIGTLTDIINLLFAFMGVWLLKSNLITLSAFVTIFLYKDRIYNMFNFYTKLQEVFKDFELSSTRVFDIIDGDKYSRETFGKKKIKKIHGDFEFDHISFSYNNEIKLIDDLSFKIKANTTTAFVGKSGCGKTTIFSLLAKLYEINNGNIYIDGININDLDEDSIRGNMTIINQSPYIFNLSIYDNLKMVAPKASKKDIINACKTANLHNFIMKLPNKYDTVVGEGGITLSGGQKQRLAIARALVQKTEIILFDEATSALDNETQDEIQKAINKMKNKYTILIIAHRFSTVIDSDKILFMEDGKIKDEGTHKELVKRCKGYKELYELELKNN